MATIEPSPDARAHAVHPYRSACVRVLRLLADERVQLGALLLLAVLVRLAFHFRSPAFVAKDSQSYFLPGWSIARGEPFDLGLRRTPGYPLFIAGVVLALGEELRSLAFAQHLLGVITVGATYLLGRLTFGRAAGLLAGLLVALNGPVLIYERYVMTESLFGLLLSTTILAAVAAAHRRSWRLWLASGAILGLAVLTRPVAQVLIPLLMLTALATSVRDWRGGLRGLVALAIGLAAVQGPWILRNALDKGSAGASTFGRTLIARTAYYDNGFVFDVPGQPDPDPRLQRARQIVQDGARQKQSDGVIAGRLRQELSLGPVEVNQVMRTIAIAAILRNPSHYFEGTLGIVWRLFVGLEERLRDHWDEYKDAHPWDDRVRALVGGPTPYELVERPTASRLANVYQPVRFAPLLAGLFVLGAAFALLVGRHRLALLPAGVVVAVLLASAALDGPVERYRYPLDPLVAVLTAGGFVGGLGVLAALNRSARRRSGGTDTVRLSTPA